MGCGASVHASSSANATVAAQPDATKKSSEPNASAKDKTLDKTPANEKEPDTKADPIVKPTDAKATSVMPPPPGCNLRIITVNDVYELDKLAHMKTCVDHHKTENYVVLLAGDFLGPSLLSSLDHGRGMVDILNRVGVQYVCFGNHEQDVPHMEMLQRIRESKFEWLATNMERLEMSDDMKPLPTYKVLTVEGSNQKRKVGLLGLNTDDAGLYLPSAWGGAGAKVIDPIVDKAIEFRKKLLAEEGCDMIVPMTHQVMPLDRQMAEKKLGFPLIIGGHDHQLYHENIVGTTVIKMGADADTIGIIDVTWPEAATKGEEPTITVQKCPAEWFAQDEELVKRIQLHKHVLQELDKASLFTVPDGVKLTSKCIRLRQVSMGTILVSAMRNALGADCAMINAGNIRGNADYDIKTFTYSNLKSEMPFDSVAAEIPLPGKIINETVRFTRQHALADPPVEKGSYMQLDDGMTWDAETNSVTHIAGEPIELDKLYECVVLWGVAIEGIDKVTPLHEYCKEHLCESQFPHDADVGRPAKQVLVDYFGRAVWWHLVEECGFSGIDKDMDGKISKQELSEAVHAHPGMEGELGDLVIENVLAMADLDHDGFVDKGELLQVSFLSLGMFETADMDGDRHLNKAEVEAVVKKILGDQFDGSMVEKLFAEIDGNKDGKLSFAEVKGHSKAMKKALRI